MSTNSLPPILEDIAREVSLEAALKLAEAKGGQRISIPPRVTSGHWLADLLGLDEAKALSKYFCHEVSYALDVPLGLTSNRAMNRAQIVELVKRGKSANEIAAAVNITRRHALRVRASIKDEAQDAPDLFQKQS